MFAIGTGAFAHCLSLRTVNFTPDSLLFRVGAGAFSQTALKSVALPQGVRKLGRGAFGPEVMGISATLNVKYE